MSEASEQPASEPVGSDHGQAASRAAEPSYGHAGGPEDPGPSGLWAWIARAVWSVGLVLIALVALAAVAVTVRVLLDTLGGGLDRRGLVWMAIAAAIIAAAAAGLLVVVHIARRGHPAWAAAVGLTTVVITRAVAIATIPTPLGTDWGAYHNGAVTLASGGGFDSARPPGWPYILSLLYRVAGPEPLAGEIFALVCAVGVAIVIYLIARRWLGDVAAAAALFLWAVSPGPAAFSAALASEHLHDLLFVGAFGVALVAVRAHRWRWVAWVGAGILLGVSQYVRPSGLVVLPAFAVLPFLVGLPPRRAALAGLSVVVAFGLVLAPSVAWQYERFGRLSLSTSNFDGWNLLVGLNVKSGGQYSRDDLALVDAAPETVEFRDRSYRLAIERLTQHPENIAILAVPKFGTMWGDSTYGATWTLGYDRPGHPRAAAALALLSQVGYTAIAVLAAAWLWLRRHARDGLGLLTVLCLEAVALSATVLEVQPRYHAWIEPVLCVLAGGSVAWLAARVRRSTAASTSTGDVRTPGPEPAVSAGIVPPSGTAISTILGI